MKKIFIGLILVFLDLTLTIGESKIGLIPDFLGYIIMMKGLVELETESTLFKKVMPYVTGMAVYSGILYIFDLFGATVSLDVLTYVLAVLSTAVSLFISYYIVMGVIDMEKKHHMTLNGNSLKSMWTLLAVCNVATFVTMLIPLVAIIFLFISFIVEICFLFAFSKTKNLYYGSVR